MASITGHKYEESLRDCAATDMGDQGVVAGTTPVLFLTVTAALIVTVDVHSLNGNEDFCTLI